MDQIDTWARSALDARHQARERALVDSRELVRTCANSIRAVHRGEFQHARGLLDTARQRSDTLARDLALYPDLFYTGYVQDAQKEYVEAEATYALIRGEPLPEPESLGVAVAPFLNGLAEAVGELRRAILDQLRRGDLSRAEEILRTMDEIYSLLVTMDYPDALTGGLRRTTDATRAIMERTRGDLTFALRQDRLEGSLRRVEERLAETPVRSSPPRRRDAEIL
ncbi:MAG: haloacid dehalogenase [Chloroflexi bacterium]|nr:haloacid dehalogenase [Chloroflexota bacterium]